MKPSGLIYGVDDRPPRTVLFLSGLQHVAVITVIGMVFPLLVADRAGVDQAARETIMSLSMMAMAVGTLLQCFRWGPVGSGFLLPATMTAAYMAASLKAAEQGGLPLVFGMTIFAGLCVVALSRVVQHLRPYLPTEISGLAVTVIGITLGTLGFRLVFGHETGIPADAGMPTPPRATVGLLVLATTVGLTLWCTGAPRLFAVLIGFVVGCVAAGLLGMLTLPAWMFEFGAGLRLPLPFAVMPSFDPMLIPDFLVAALACSLRAMGDITTCQRINDATWKRQDITSIRGGLLADGLATVAAGLIGTLGMNTSSNSIGIAAATGVTARRVGLAIAVILLILALAPRPRGFLASMPLEVAGGVLLFSSCFIIVNGIKIIVGRMLDIRMTLVIGLSLVLGLSHAMFPQIYAELPSALRSMLGSDLVVAMLTAILLNLLFRIGVARRASFRLSADSPPDLPYSAMQTHGGSWGARPEIVAKVVGALVAFREHADELLEKGAEAEVEVAFDEYAIRLKLRYRGKAPALAGAAGPLPADLLERDADDVESLVRLRLLTRFADRVRAEQRGDEAILRLRFDH